MRAIVHEPVPSARLARADVPPRLDAILRKALAKDPGQRFQTAGEMYVALERFLAEQGEFVHAMHIANAIETLLPNAASRGPFGPDSNPSQKALQLESGSRPAGGRTKSDKNQKMAPESDPDLDTLDNQMVPAAFDIELGDPMDEDEDLPTEQWSGEQIPSVIKQLQAEAAAGVSDDATTNVASANTPGVPSIFTEETAALDPATGGPLQAAAIQPSPDDPFARPASFAPEPKGPSTLLRVSVVVLALCAAALVTVAVVWSTTSGDPEPEGEGETTTAGEETETSTQESGETTDEGTETTEGGDTEELATSTDEGEEETEVAPAPTTGTVTVTTEPAGARVRMNDREGVAPVTWDDVEAGTHTVTASLEGRVDAEGEFVVEAGRPAEVRLTLIEERPDPPRGDMEGTSSPQMRRAPPPQGTLVLDTQPRGTRVFFGRTALGRTPLRARLPVGTVRLRLVTPDGEDHIRSVRVRPSGESRAFLPLSR
jgi:hypothetical protein